MLFRSDKALGIHDGSTVSNRTRICHALGIDYMDVVFQRIIYTHSATYDLLAEVDTRSTSKHTSEVVADALFTEAVGVGLFLPVADCVATIIHDPVGKRLALLHLGRHSTLTDLITKTIAHFEARGSRASDLVVWMSPSAGLETYKLDYFDHQDSPEWQAHLTVGADGIYIDLRCYNKQRFIDEGVRSENIHMSTINTMTDSNYFSHAMGDTNGRMAAIAIMR